MNALSYLVSLLLFPCSATIILSLSTIFKNFSPQLFWEIRA
ncbi:hypothetical protein RINTHM_4710 [Richelia intracellularis HM01]|nr:hypothetical protein RINTHM_4710 [Richelia intracellularis HM01]